MIHSKLLEEADMIISKDRENTYGSPDKNLKTIAEYWTTHIQAKYGNDNKEGKVTLAKNIKLDINDVCVMMVLLKQARLANTPTHHDSMVDTAGYVALMHKCQENNSAYSSNNSSNKQFNATPINSPNIYAIDKNIVSKKTYIKFKSCKKGTVFWYYDTQGKSIYSIKIDFLKNKHEYEYTWRSTKGTIIPITCTEFEYLANSKKETQLDVIYLNILYSLNSKFY